MNPLFINIVSIISIIVMVILIGVMFYKKPLKLGKNIIWFSLPTFIVGFFLHLIAYIEANTNDPLIYGLLTTIFTTIKMFGFNVNDTLLAALVHENFLYTVAVVITNLVSSFNTILILFILLLAGFGNDLKVLMYKKTNHFIVFGSNKEVLTSLICVFFKLISSFSLKYCSHKDFTISSCSPCKEKS